jgi:O-antigen ligase
VAAGSLARVILLCLAIYLFFDLAWGPARRIGPERIVRCLFWTGSVSASFAVADFLLQLPAPTRFAEQFVWLSSGVFRRAQGIFYEASTLGNFCAFLLIMLTAIAVTGLGPRLGIRRVWLWSAASVIVSALIFSFSRAAIVNVCVSLIALAFLERRRFRLSMRTARLPAAACAAAAAGLLLAAVLFPEFLAVYLTKLRHSAEFLFSEPNLVLSRRLESWALLANYIQETPWDFVLGIGYKTLPYSDHLGQPLVADNMYLSLLIETGWPGVLALLGLSAAVLFQSYREARYAASEIRRFCGIWMFSFWCGEMVQMLSGDILTYWRILPAFFAVLAIGSRDDDFDPGPIL